MKTKFSIIMFVCIAIATVRADIQYYFKVTGYAGTQVAGPFSSQQAAQQAADQERAQGYSPGAIYSEGSASSSVTTPSTGGLNPMQQQMYNSIYQSSYNLGFSLFGGNVNAEAQRQAAEQAARLAEQRRLAAQKAAKELAASVDAQAKITDEKQAQLNAEAAKIADEKQQRLLGMMKKIGADSDLLPKMDEPSTLQLKTGTAFFGIPGNPSGELKLKDLNDPNVVDLRDAKTSVIDPAKVSALTPPPDSEVAVLAPQKIEVVPLSAFPSGNSTTQNSEHNPNFTTVDNQNSTIASAGNEEVNKGTISKENPIALSAATDMAARARADAAFEKFVKQHGDKDLIGRAAAVEKAERGEGYTKEELEAQFQRALKLWHQKHDGEPSNWQGTPDASPSEVIIGGKG